MSRLRHLIIILLLALGLGLLSFGLIAQAQEGEAPPPPPAAPQARLHPPIRLLDSFGLNVSESGGAVSAKVTCGVCHDSTFIEEHSYHADLGLSQQAPAGTLETGRPWDTSTGLFGRWEPLTYRYLSPEGDPLLDLTTAEWIQTQGWRHVGGGPALYSRSEADTRLSSLDPELLTVETGVYDAFEEGLIPWDWSSSGGVEMNCFLCHIGQPDNAGRISELAAGNFQWATTATLSNTGLVMSDGWGWVWDAAAFDEEGYVNAQRLGLQDPSSENCGQCHGAVHTNSQIPLELSAACDDLSQWTTATTGQVISPQRLQNSAANLADKNTLSRTWDVHAERVIECSQCHFALNNPVYYEEAENRPEHLTFDPRRMDFGDYLYRPDHNFAKGGGAQSQFAGEFDNTQRTCEACHDAEVSHEWLPYQDRHMDVLACESCHVPQLYAPALQSVDWSVLKTNGRPLSDCRGVVEDGGSSPLISGYEPVLLPRDKGDGQTRLAPHNLITAWYWTYGDPARPVPLRYLEAAWLLNGAYVPEVLALFDADTDGALSDEELRLDTPEKQALIQSRLAAQGLDNLALVGELQPYSINHNVVGGDWALRDCQACHADESRVSQGITLADYTPHGASLNFAPGQAQNFSGQLEQENQAWVYTPDLQSEQVALYVLGHNNLPLVDYLGLASILGVSLAIFGHSSLRYLSARQPPPHHGALRREYMYTVYERQWHWLQTALILGLIFSGLVIHKPEYFGMFSFRYMVSVHNVLAAILVVNAALAAFYHLVSGEIQQFIPQPRDFFHQAILQARYYLWGIFRGEPHPFEKSAKRKMNPLQQITYLAILNVLLPLQVITGAIMWGAQRYPDQVARIGGLTYLGPIHSLVAWLFVSFIIAHVYLTTTGHTPLAGIRAMVVGWDELEGPAPTADTTHTENIKE